MLTKPHPINWKQNLRELLLAFALVATVIFFFWENGFAILKGITKLEMRSFDHTFKERIDFHTFTNTAHALMAQPWSEAKTNAIKQFEASLPKMPQCFPPRVYVAEMPDGSKKRLVVFYMVGLVAYDIVVATPDVSFEDLEKGNENRENKPRRAMAEQVYLYRLNI